MKGDEKLSKTSDPVNAENPTPKTGRRKLFPFLKALDARGQPIRGLWVRNGRFYARLALEDANTGRKQVRRIPLDVETVAQAQAKLRELLTRRERKALPVLRQTPKFKDYVENYLDYYAKAKAKREKTLAVNGCTCASGSSTWGMRG